ncbi:MAG: hypothetical protein ACT4OW_00220 [Nitrososphaerota archaeon]
MTLTRADVITIDATVIAGILILLTVSNIVLESEARFSGFFNFIYTSLVVASMFPFTVSAAREIDLEIQFKLRERIKKLEEALKDAKDNKKRESKIQEDIERTKHGLKELPIYREFYSRDEATIGGLKSMKLGFYYIMVVLGIILVASQIQFMYTFEPEIFENFEDRFDMTSEDIETEIQEPVEP